MRFSSYNQKKNLLYCAWNKEKIWREEKLRDKQNNMEWKKKWVHSFTQTRYIQPTVREVFIDLKDEKSDTNDFKSAAKCVSCCLEKLKRWLHWKKTVIKLKKQILTHGCLTKKASPWSKIYFTWLFHWHKDQASKDAYLN